MTKSYNPETEIARLKDLLYIQVNDLRAISALITDCCAAPNGAALLTNAATLINNAASELEKTIDEETKT
jgi:hypothetical protein